MELIKDRLAHIIRAKNLTATQFAEMMQIQPSNVSHLLSGRNKPSLDFLIKLKDVFPEYSFDWIILGKKPITVSEPKSGVKEEFYKPEDVQRIQPMEPEFNAYSIDILNETKAEAKQLETKNVCQDFAKTIKQIVYVYEDGTFEIYTNRKMSLINNVFDSL